MVTQKRLGTVSTRAFSLVVVGAFALILAILAFDWITTPASGSAATRGQSAPAYSQTYTGHALPYRPS